MKLIIISGKSGAGKSVALDVLEDMDFYCVDNLPVILLPNLVDILFKTNNNIAISVDIRNLPQSNMELDETFSKLPTNIEIIHCFLDADKKTLIQRYSDSRREHPLTNKKTSLEQAIDLENTRLIPIIALADHIIDTSNLSNHQLSDKLRSLILGVENKELHITFESFGYKYGLPLNADFIFDVRFLPNPHWEMSLRKLTGLDQEIIDFFHNYNEVKQFIDTTASYIDTWLPLIEKNNRSYLTIAIGCTGGKHRSVYVTEQLANYFIQKGKNVNIYHRTLSSN